MYHAQVRVDRCVRLRDSREGGWGGGGGVGGDAARARNVTATSYPPFSRARTARSVGPHRGERAHLEPGGFRAQVRHGRVRRDRRARLKGGGDGTGLWGWDGVGGRSWGCLRGATIREATRGLREQHTPRDLCAGHLNGRDEHISCGARHHRLAQTKERGLERRQRTWRLEQHVTTPARGPPADVRKAQSARAPSSARVSESSRSSRILAHLRERGRGGQPSVACGGMALRPPI